jgi:hypothetical protein
MFIFRNIFDGEGNEVQQKSGQPKPKKRRHRRKKRFIIYFV